MAINNIGGFIISRTIGLLANILKINNIYVLCGLPGSGKTTIAKKLAKRFNAKFYSFDEYKIKAKQIHEMTTHQCFYKQISAEVISGNNIVLDDLNTKVKSRQELLQSLNDISCKKILIVMTTPLEECLERNRYRAARLSDFIIYNLYKSYQPPELSEGWDEILYF